MTKHKEFKILQPKYYSKFQCDPIKCQESCCERWKIIIDKNTYEKYIGNKNETIKEIVKTGLSLNETSMNDDDYAIINLNKEMACPFLNENNLCEVFINMGEDSLSKTCKSYPRALTSVNGVIERGLEMTCSVAAERALLNEKGIEFQYIMDNIKLDDMYVVAPPVKDVEQLEIIKEIRTVVIDLLQTRTIELSERIACIGYFLRQVVRIVEASGHNYEEVRSRIKEEIQPNLEEFKMTEGKHERHNSRPFHYFNTILSMKFQKGDSVSFFSNRYIPCLMQVLDAFADVEEEDLEKYYRRSYEENLKPYLDQKSYVLENFLVNYVFIHGIELFNPKDIWHAYLKLCVVYGLIKFNLVGLATYHEEMNDDLALRLIQSLSKTIIQDKTYWQSVIEYLEAENLDAYNRLITLIVD